MLFSTRNWAKFHDGWVLVESLNLSARIAYLNEWLEVEGLDIDRQFYLKRRIVEAYLKSADYSTAEIALRNYISEIDETTDGHLFISLNECIQFPAFRSQLEAIVLEALNSIHSGLMLEKVIFLMRLRSLAGDDQGVQNYVESLDDLLDNLPAVMNGLLLYANESPLPIASPGLRSLLTLAWGWFKASDQFFKYSINGIDMLEKAVVQVNEACQLEEDCN